MDLINQVFEKNTLRISEGIKMTNNSTQITLNSQTIAMYSRFSYLASYPTMHKTIKYPLKRLSRQICLKNSKKNKLILFDNNCSNMLRFETSK